MTLEERASRALKIKESRTWPQIKAEIQDLIEEKRSSKTFESSSIFGVQADLLLELIDNIENKHSQIAAARNQAEQLTPNDFK